MGAIREEEVQVPPAAMATIREPAKRSFAWLYGLLALLVLGGLLWMLLSRNTTPVPTAQVATAPAVTAPAVPAAPAPVTDTLSVINQELNRNVLNFATASSVLPDGSTAPLQSAADRIKTLPAGTRIEVGGHTDNTGSAAANLALSQRRADAVREALVQDGVDTSMLTTKGYGETKPIAPNDTPEGRLQNRRTEFTVAGAETTTTTTNANP
jgi:outer membrane protein OmpA-like peptidoglycan-associated protein